VTKRRNKYLPVDKHGEFLTGPALYEEARRLAGDRLILAFSRGKDSIATWLELRDYFEIVPYYCYLVPGGLSYERESLAYYEDFFQTKIHRFLQPIFWHNLNGTLFQPPQRLGTIIGCGVPDYDYFDLVQGLGQWVGIERPFVAFGYRAEDSLRRRLLIEREGPLGSENYRYFWPLWDWTLERVATRLKAAGVKLPVDYHVFGWTLTATDYQYSHALRDHFPEDWEKLKFWYPLIEAEMFRHEVVNRDARRQMEQAE
jgi:hypothetical protein